MEKSLIDPLKSRLQKLGAHWETSNGECVLYVMSRDQRVHDNHALLAAQRHALSRKLPLAVLFVLQITSQQRAQEHYQFMIDGLSQVESELKKYNIPFIALIGRSQQKLTATFGHFKPAAIYVDFNPLSGRQNLVKKLAKDWPIIEVDTHNVVPVWLASTKQEVGARTLRPKIHSKLAHFFIEPEPLVLHPFVWPSASVLPVTEIADLLAKKLVEIPKNNTIVSHKSGETAAKIALTEFLKHRFEGYAVNRNNPTIDGLSGLSPYFHFGQLSSLRVALEAHALVLRRPQLQVDYDALLEEMIVRKELSDNFCYYNPLYKSLKGVPDWAQKTLAKHQHDTREFVYALTQFEAAETHDEAWNAAQRQLRKTGKIHGYMRMYWAKKVLEWSSSPEDALNILLYLNDFYSIDGGDPNGYVGILWSIAGLHDRPWGERPVYGTVRCMVYNGLKRKFDIQAYIDYN